MFTPFYRKIALRVTLGFLCALFAIISLSNVWNTLQTTSLSQILQIAVGTPHIKLFGALVIVIINYIVIIGYDLFGMRFAGSGLPLKQLAPIAFMGDAINANTPFSAIVGSIIKLRLYLKLGISPGTVGIAIASYTFAYWAGYSVILLLSGAITFIVTHQNQPSSSVFYSTATSLFAVSVIALYLLINQRFIPLPKKMSTVLPRDFTGLKLLAVGCSDWFLSALLFLVLTPASVSPLQIPQIIHSYLIGHALGIVSQLPGGIGVFENTTLLLNPTVAPSALFASLFLFRLFFFILPLIVALILLPIWELRFNGTRKSKTMKSNPPTNRLLSSCTALPSIAIIVPAFNEESDLPACLKALTAQDYPGKYSITVVDNGSTDSTAEIARSFGCTVIHESRKGYNYAIKRGYDSADGDILASTDADTIVPSDWLSKIAQSMNEQSIVACGGVFSFHDGSPPLKLIGYLFGKLNYHVAGANMAVRRSAYIRCGGFSTDVNLGADVEIGIRLKAIGKVKIDRSLVVATSSRRFAQAFWKTIFMYYVNDFCLIILKRPLFHAFADIRTSSSGFRYSRGLASVAVAFLLILVAGWILELPQNQLLGATHVRGPRIKAIALTFDDGPGPSTDTILTILKTHHATATFFVIGKNARQYPETMQRIVNEGHEIGNHSFSHRVKCAIESPLALQKELRQTDSVIYATTGKTTHLFRPPHGWRSPWMLQTCSRLGYATILWTIDSQDWQPTTAPAIISRLLNKTGNGSIILMHDRLNTKTARPRATTIAALPTILDSLSAAGYSFVTVSKLLSLHEIYGNSLLSHSLNTTASQ